jgi:hypothetical protein
MHVEPCKNLQHTPHAPCDNEAKKHIYTVCVCVCGRERERERESKILFIAMLWCPILHTAFYSLCCTTSHITSDDTCLHCFFNDKKKPAIALWGSPPPPPPPAPRTHTRCHIQLHKHMMLGIYTHTHTHTFSHEYSGIRDELKLFRNQLDVAKVTISLSSSHSLIASTFSTVYMVRV